MRSLDAFLAHNRSWQRAASVLHVHKQTLVSRIRRIEVLTGRRLNETADVAELWLALQAHDVAHGSPSARPERS
jgi:PucR family transcriptional regulator, purine catabolism regulatory protein